MTLAQAEQIVKTLLYEGYALYPYRASAVKNRQRWTFGCLLPRSYCEENPESDDWQMQTECLVRGGTRTHVEVRVRFLQIVARVIGEPTPNALSSEEASILEPGYRPVDWLEIDDRQYHTWQESIEREVFLNFPLSQGHCSKTIDFPPNRDCKFLRDKREQTVGVCMHEQKAVTGTVEVSAESLGGELLKLSVRISNLADCERGELQTRHGAILNSLVSTHVIFSAQCGEFVSLLDPPEEFREQTLLCKNQRAWPVLIGQTGSRDMMLASPIILYDYPRIAPESPGNLFDGTEIEEILSLRIQTLTEDEKRQAAFVDNQVRELLQRTHALSDEHLMDMHGRASLRPSDTESPSQPSSLPFNGSFVRPGDRVRLRPRGRADAMDLILNGRLATVQSIEQDFEDNFYVAVTIDDDPGRDLGESGLPGHRFFFRGDEIERITTLDNAP
jgi:hypothetical protein